MSQQREKTPVLWSLGVRTMLLSGGIYGGFMALFFAGMGLAQAVATGAPLAQSAVVGAMAGVGAGVVFGAAFSLWATLAQSAGLTSYGARRIPTNVTVHQKWHLSVPRPAVDVMSRARQILEERGISKIIAQSQGRLVVRTSVNFRSWGEIVTVTVDDQGGESSVELESRPRLWTQIIDSGANYKNVLALSDALVDLVEHDIDGAPASETTAERGRAARARASERQ